MIVEVIEKSGYKRRDPNRVCSEIVSVAVVNYEQIHNSFCSLIVTFQDGTTKTYISRVVYNDLKDYWTIDGMHVAVKVIAPV